MSLRILITGTTGDSMPPPYAGIPNVSLLYGRAWKKAGNDVAITFVYKPKNADDLGANAEYYFEYAHRPNKFRKALFLIRYFFRNPFLYISLFRKYASVNQRLSIEIVLYSAYGVFMDSVIAAFKPDIILSQAALIKTFMVSEIAKQRNIPIVYNTYAEVHDQRMGVNKHMSHEQQKEYWTYFMSLADLVIGMDNCSVGPLMYLPPEKVKVFYDTCDFGSYQIELMETVDELRKSFGLPSHLFLVGMMGAFHYRKGHDELIKAVARLKLAGHQIGAVIVGGNVGLEKWQDLAAAEGVSDRVFFFQNFNESNKIRLYRCIDAYANLSNSPRSCGLDLALLEAMSCSLPIVVYDNGALPGAVPEGKNGYVVKTGDIDAVAEAVLKLCKKTSSERKDMAQESNKVASRTDIKLTSEIKLRWFKDIVGKTYKA